MNDSLTKATLTSVLLTTLLALHAHGEPATATPAKATKAAKVDSATEPTEKSKATADKKAAAWRSLFNGRDLTNWKSTNFGGEGEVEVNAEKALVLNMGSSLTGVTWSPAAETPALPKNNYEIELEARRTVGGDFFCGLTFPYKEKHASLILGGWGGGVIGISCIDHYDASENDTTTYHAFKQNQWYKVKLRVTEGKFEAWIDNKSFVDVDIANSDIGVRAEVELSRPLGLASFTTTAEVRNIKLRTITPPAAAKKTEE